MSDHVKIHIVLSRVTDEGKRVTALVSLTESNLEKPNSVEDPTAPLLLRAQFLDWKILPLVTSYAVSGTTLFQLGGRVATPRCPTNLLLVAVDQIYYTNLAAGNRAWTKAPCSMNVRRGGPDAVSVDGKIYIFGGLTRPKDKPYWAEVYDTKSQKCSVLKCPDSIDPESNDYVCCLLDMDSIGLKKILVYETYSGLLCAYDLKEHKWEEDFGMKLKLNVSRQSSGVNYLLPSGRLLFIVSSKWWVFDCGIMKHRGIVPGFKALIHRLPEVCREPHSIFCLGCRDDGKTHCFLLLFCSSVNGVTFVYVVRIAVVEDCHGHFSFKLESVRGFRMERGIRILGHFYATADLSKLDGGEYSGEAQTEDAHEYEDVPSDAESDEDPFFGEYVPSDAESDEDPFFGEDVPLDAESDEDPFFGKDVPSDAESDEDPFFGEYVPPNVDIQEVVAPVVVKAINRVLKTSSGWDCVKEEDTVEATVVEEEEEEEEEDLVLFEFEEGDEFSITTEGEMVALYAGDSEEVRVVGPDDVLRRILSRGRVTKEGSRYLSGGGGGGVVQQLQSSFWYQTGLLVASGFLTGLLLTRVMS